MYESQSEILRSCDGYEYFPILKVGTVHNNHYQSYDELKSVVTNCVCYYNKWIKTKLVVKKLLQY
ncbi:IS3 family transposase [Leuconostoc lactis]|uniref:IS3 family transposase n=1 Tax=Leuconostoc lactis TaxID=1246 RepID=UPI000EE80246|nr:hypothetical protein [Leuconostoc lactis]